MHIIQAVVLKGPYKQEEALKYDLRGVDVGFDLSLFFIDNYYTAYWQKKLGKTGFLETNGPNPHERVIFDLMKMISKEQDVDYAIIQTAYVGGMGDQYANLYRNDQNVDPTIDTINAALEKLGVQKRGDDDEFDTIGLGKYRRNPDYLDKYEGLLDELGG